jgi:hypothetical protein
MRIYVGMWQVAREYLQPLNGINEMFSQGLA